MISSWYLLILIISAFVKSDHFTYFKAIFIRYDELIYKNQNTKHFVFSIIMEDDHDIFASRYQDLKIYFDQSTMISLYQIIKTLISLEFFRYKRNLMKLIRRYHQDRSSSEIRKDIRNLSSDTFIIARVDVFLYLWNLFHRSTLYFFSFNDIWSFMMTQVSRYEISLRYK